MSDETLEQQLADLMAEAAAHPARAFQPFVTRAGRLLQLARREGLEAGLGTSIGCEDESIRQIAIRAHICATYPLPPVTREVPRVEPDPHLDGGNWTVENDAVRYVDPRGNRWLFETWLRSATIPEPRFTPERCDLWKKLLLHPTRTETVEE